MQSLKILHTDMNFVGNGAMVCLNGSRTIFWIVVHIMTDDICGSGLVLSNAGQLCIAIVYD